MHKIRYFSYTRPLATIKLMIKFIQIIILSIVVLSCKSDNTTELKDEITYNNLKILDIKPHIGVDDYSLGDMKSDFVNNTFSIDIHKMELIKSLKDHELMNYYPLADSVFVTNHHNQTLVPSYYFRNDTIVRLSAFTFPHGEYDSIVFTLNNKYYGRYDIKQIKKDYHSEIKLVVGDSTIGTLHNTYFLTNQNISLLEVNNEIRVIDVY